MQTSTQSPDIAPPATQGPPGTLIIGKGGQTMTFVPLSKEEVAALIKQREAISDQLTNVSDRRHDLSQELQGTADPVARQGLEDRIRVLDQRILALENDLATTGRQLSSASPTIIATAESGMPSPANLEEQAQYEGMLIGGLGMLGVCAAVFFINRRRWKRKGRAIAAGMSDDSARRLERLEQGMEAIAIEIERVSEGQRFVTKLLSQSQQPIPAASNNGDPLVVEQKSIKG